MSICSSYAVPVDMFTRSHKKRITQNEDFICDTQQRDVQLRDDAY
jgi:hypothetical protein